MSQLSAKIGIATSGSNVSGDIRSWFMAIRHAQEAFSLFLFSFQLPIAISFGAVEALRVRTDSSENHAEVAFGEISQDLADARDLI